VSAAVTLVRRDPAVVAAQAHAVLDAVARLHPAWPRGGRKVLGESALSLDEALLAYNAAAAGDGDPQETSEAACTAMVILLMAAGLFLGEETAYQVKRASEAVR
jgi:hypothetical protein